MTAMGRTCTHVACMEEFRNTYSVLVARHEEKRSLGRLKCRWEDNIKMDLEEYNFEGVSDF